MKLFLPVFCWLLIPLSHTLSAQIPGMHIYDASDGFTPSIGHQINQDSTGYIWIGSNKGLIRFDGHRFTEFTQKDGLRDQEIFDALPSPNNYVFIKPLVNNIAYYKDGKIVNEYENKELARLQNSVFNEAHKDRHTGDIWVSDGRNEGHIYKFSKGHLIPVPIPLEGYFSLLNAFKNKLVLRSSFQLKLYDVNENKMSDFEVEGDSNCHFEAGVLVFSPDNKYIVGLHRLSNTINIYKIKSQSKAVFTASLHLNRSPKRIIISDNNQLWINFAEKGLQYWGAVSELNKNSTPLEVLRSTIVNGIFTDRDDNIWVTTERKGLYFVASRHWENYLKNLTLNLPQTTPSFIGSNGQGLIFTGLDNKSYLTVIKGDSSYQVGLKKNLPEGLNHMEYKYNRLYAGGINHIYDLESKENKRLELKAVYNIKGSVKDIAFHEPDSTLLIASSNGVYTLNPYNNNSSAPRKTEHMWFDQRSTCVFPLALNKILIGTPSGLFLAVLNKNTFRRSEHVILKRANITDIEEINSRSLLISTAADGLFTYDLRSEEISSLKPGRNGEFGLVHNIFRESDDAMWLATDRGVFHLEFREGKSIDGRRYSVKDGLPSNSVSSLIIHNQNIYAATAAGLAILPIYGASEKTPKVAILEATAGDTSFYQPDKLDILGRDRNVSIRLSSFTYHNPGQSNYNYTLKGHSSKWFTTSNPEINFYDLDPGEYTFLVKNAEESASENILPSRLNIVVYPVLWETQWFRILIGLIGLCLVLAFLYMLHLRHKRAALLKLTQKRKLAQLELEAIKAQINPHFIYNCLNSIQFFNYKKDYQNTRQYLEHFSLLLRQTMRLSQQIFTTIEEELDYLNTYLQLQKMRFSEGLDYEILKDKDLDTQRILPAMLLQPFVENSVKHGVSGQANSCLLHIELGTTDENWLLIKIKDNGPGIKEKKNEESHSLGLRLSGSRVQTYNQLFNLKIKLNFYSVHKNTGRAHTGTTVELLIPPLGHEKIKF